MSSAGPLQWLLHAGLRGSPSRGLDDLVGVVGDATASTAAFLWESTAGGVAPSPTVVAAWSAGGEPRPAAPDACTAEAFATRAPVFAEAASPQRAAFPVALRDGSDGVLTLAGPGELGSEQFDLAVDLLDVLPDLHHRLRERQVAALLDRCDALLSDPGNTVLTGVCTAVAEAWGCSEVVLRLSRPSPARGGDPLTASTGGTGDAHDLLSARGRWPGFPEPTVRTVDGVTTVVLPLRAGEEVTGALGCRRRDRPLGSSEYLALLTVAERLAYRLTSWEDRARHAAEVASWRSLARSITDFNAMLSDELARRSHRDDRVYDAAITVVDSVVPGLTGGHVWRSRTGPGASGLGHAHGYRADGGRDNGDGANGDGAGDPPSAAAAARTYRAGRQQPTTDRRQLARLGYGPEVGWLVSTPIGIGDTAYGVLDAFGTGPELPAISAQVCRIVGDHLGLYEHLRGTLDHLRVTRRDLEETVRRQAETLEDLKHQLVSPLLSATSRIEQILEAGRVESRTAAELRAVRGLCRKASRVAMSAGVFAALSHGHAPSPRLEFHGADDLLRVLIGAADDAQQLSNPRRGIRFTVERDSVRGLGRRLLRIDRSFLEQCVGNLLDNAAKYSYQDTDVQIRGTATKDGFAVSVLSTGIGLSDGDAEQCQERNWRSPLARSVTGEGSGLGLWICSQLMASMGGSVAVVPDGDVTAVHLRFPFN